MKAVALTGGGTGGHVYPCLALIPELAKRFDKIIYIGGNGMEKGLVADYGLPFFEIRSIKFDRRNLLNDFKIPFVLSASAKEAEAILRRESVSVVFGKGGYVSIPACLGARRAGIPVVIHESDFTMGAANRLVNTFSAATLTSFPETRGGEFVGNPVREELFLGNAERARKKFGLCGERRTILVFGGSSGSAYLNKVIIDCARSLTQSYNVIHITGNGKNIETPSMPYYKAIPYCYEMGDLYALADLVVMRAGAGSLSECALLGKRVIAVPLPKGISRGDQIKNAQSYEKRGLADVIAQDSLNPSTLGAAVEKAFRKSPKRQSAVLPNSVIAQKLFDLS